MSYVALYRKWRPKTFEDVVGQKHVSETLQRAIREDKVAHAYVFAGPRGTGKTSLAKILARAINCEHGPTDHPCNECTNCKQMLAGTSMDVVEIDAASNRGIDEIRALRESTRFLPVEGRKKIFIIDEAHMLTTEAWNALLKTIEEPPPHIMFIFATTEQDKIPVTILSRCQRYTFRRITAQDIAAHITHVAHESDIALDAGAAQLIAVHADGGLRDALSMLDQCASMGESPITTTTVERMMGLVSKEWVMHLLTHIHEGNGAQVIMDVQQALQQGREAPQMLEALAQHLRALLIARVLPDAEELAVYDALKDEFVAQGQVFSPAVLSYYTKEIQDIQVQAKRVDNPRIVIEMGLLALCARQAQRNDDWENRVAVLEDRVQQETERMQNRMAALETKTPTVDAVHATVAPVAGATGVAPNGMVAVGVVSPGGTMSGAVPGAVAPPVGAVPGAVPPPGAVPGTVPPVSAVPGTVPPVSAVPGTVPPSGVVPGTVPPGAVPPPAVPGAVPPPGMMPPPPPPVRGTVKKPKATGLSQGAPEVPLSQMPVAPTVKTIGVTETDESAVIGEGIVPMKDYKSIFGTVLQWMESQKYNMSSAQYKRGQLIYVDNTKAVVTFNSDFALKIAQQEPTIQEVRDGFSATLKRPMNVVVVGHKTKADQEYREVVRQMASGQVGSAPRNPGPTASVAPSVAAAPVAPAVATPPVGATTPATPAAAPVAISPLDSSAAMPKGDAEEVPHPKVPDLASLEVWDVSKMPEEERNNPLLMKALENLSQDHDIYMEFIEEDEDNVR